MKRLISIHGWEGHPEEGWRPWLANELKDKFIFINPQMPDPITPTLDKWLAFISPIINVADKETYLLGHSLGCVTILKYLETLSNDQKIGGALLVAGFGKDLNYPGYKGELSNFFKTPIDWHKVRAHCNKFIAIHSDNDPFVPLENNKLFVDKLGAISFIEHNMKHFSGDDGVNELPVLRDAILKEFI